MSRKNTILSMLVLILISFLLTGKPIHAFAQEDKTICKGVTIDNVNVGNMTREQARAAMLKFMEMLTSKGIAITAGDTVIYATVGDMGYTANINDVVEEAINLGQKGNLIKRYKDLKDIEQGNLKLSLKFEYDEGKIREFVKKNISVANIAPVNASVAIKNGKLVYTNEKAGSKVNVKDTAKEIEKAFDNWDREDIVIDAVVEKDIPKYTIEDVKKCDTILGTYTTDYSSSAAGRAANLANGARLVNNTVLYPGDTFSAYKVLSPFTEENGYKVAGAYLKGKVIDSVGGGACQVTTTLYNAVLQAELDIVERQNHSMTISYVDLSRDAAIAGTSKDFKFKNNTKAPILIQAFTYNRKITFKVWGQETRDTKNRKLEFVSEIISKSNPPADIITKDPTRPVTYRSVTTAAHMGYKARLWKIVYENGAKVEKTLVNTSNYQSAARCITIGTKVVKKETDTNDTKDTDAENSIDKSKGTNTPKDTDTTDNTDSSENSDIEN